jgi:hypothetical protein
MKWAREITGVIFVALEIVHGAMHLISADLSDAFRQPDAVTGLIGTASWLAFTSFASFAFRQFSYRWLRVITAFLAFFLLPLAAFILFSRFSPTLPLEWILRLPAILTLVSHIIQLGVAGFIYLWSVRREHSFVAAVGADPAT